VFAEQITETYELINVHWCQTLQNFTSK